MRRQFVLFLFLTFAGFTNAASAISVEASLARPSMALGQSNTYTITIRDAASAPQLDPPNVPGLVFGGRASSHNASRMVNGTVSRELSFSWTFQAERKGRFVIPERQIQIGNQRFVTNPVTVVVTDIPPEMRNRFSLRWKVPDPPFFVGQAIPATLQLYVRAGTNAGLGSAPDGSSEQFIQTEFSGEPRQRQEMVNGQPFVVVEWDTVITPIRSGSGDLPISLLLAYETGEMRRDIFGTRAVQEQIRLTTGSYNWEVRDLPRADRPASFSGGVGNFSVETKLSRTEMEVGDPVTFSLEVHGEGNFERIQAPEFPETDGWRIYPPRAQMQDEGVPFRGVKTFEYILTPTSETVREAPAIAFSWFDPEEASWREVEIEPEPVKVEPGSGTAARDRLAGTEEDDLYSDTDDKDLQPIATSAGRSGTLVEPWRQPAFWAVNGSLACLLALGLTGVVRNRRAAQNPLLRARSESARQAREFAAEALKAAERQDALLFYTRARQSLRHYLATLDPNVPTPESLTWDELERILHRFDFPEDALARMRALFGRKDAVEFAGWKPTDEELRADRTSFETLLNEIGTHKR